jgi:IS1 family transposase
MDEKMRELPCRRVQVDEIWSYVGKKQRHVRPEDDRTRVGDQWTFVAIDSDTKLVPAYLVGKRNSICANIFMRDLSMRLANRIQLSSDAMDAYADAVERSFGAEVDYGQAVKFYEAEPIGPGRYSPPKVVDMERSVIAGNPDQRHISTSHIERQNLTMRMSMRRFTRLTNGFSKKIENMKAAVSLHFAHYNFVRQHKSLRMTPAMACGRRTEHVEFDGIGRAHLQVGRSHGREVIRLAKNEKTSGKVASIASKALQKPSSVTPKQIKTLAASVLTQAPDKGRRGSK